MNKHNITTLYNQASELNKSNHLLTSAENHVLSSSSLLSVNNISSDLIQNRNLENVNDNINNNQIIMDTYRPTYVSYLSKTLPRGPYLQYKYKDQQNAIKNLKYNDNNSDKIIQSHNQHLIYQQQRLTSQIEEQNHIKNSANTIKTYNSNNNNNNGTDVGQFLHPPVSNMEIYRQHETEHNNNLMTSSTSKGNNNNCNYQNIDISNYGITLPYRQKKSGQLLDHKYDHYVQPKKFNKQLSDCEIYKNHINPIYTQEANTNQYNSTTKQQYNQKYQNHIYSNSCRNENEHYLYSSQQQQQNLPHINGCQTLPFNFKKTSINQIRTEIEPYKQNSNKKMYKSISNKYQQKINDNNTISSSNNQIFNKDEPEIKINHFEHLNINNNIQCIEKENNICLAQGHKINRNPNMFTHISNNFGNNNHRSENKNKINIFPDMNYEKSKCNNNNKKKTILTPTQLHYVTLADVCFMKSEGLNEIEGWAILCQSVQALQDLFLSDTPSITKVLPLVRASTVQITTRGRIVFNLTSIGEFHNPSTALISSGAASYFDITAHISPEYLNSLGKKIIFPESDVEKMWIYSLGITLRKTLKSQRLRNSKTTTNIEPLYKPQHLNNVFVEYTHQQVKGRLNSNSLHRHKPINNFGSIYGIQTENGYLEVKPTLDEVIDCMCEKNFYERCSLMFLLDLNPERTNLRRLPQSIVSLNPSFNDDLFNFKKIHSDEKILQINFDDNLITLIINKSPLTIYHSLICPNLLNSLPQKLTVESISFAISFIGYMKDKNFRIGYNSPCAVASVNHLHLHLMYITADLFVDNVVISKYFRNQNQIKPFSHIVMEIVKEVAIHLEKTKLINCKTEEIGKILENEIIHENDQMINKLKINHDRIVKNYGYDKYSTIGGNTGFRDLPEPGKNSKSHQLIVRRKNRRKNDNRRNTIDVNISDLKKASEAFQNTGTNLGRLLNFSKSTNYIETVTNDENERFEDKLDKMRLCDISVSELNFYNSERNINSKISTNRQLQTNNLKPSLTKAYSEESFLTKGPEFITKSNLSSRDIDLYNNNNLQNADLNHQIVHVLLLNGQSLYITCNSISTTTQEIFEAILKSENYIENYFLGLCVLIGGDFVFLPNNFKIYKVAPQNWLHTYRKSTNHHCNIYFTLFLRIKFFLPTLRGVSSLESRHMLYLQLRKNILEKHILCTDDDLIILGGLALQAEIGDFKETLKYTEYFTLSHYLPENVYSCNKEMAKYLRNSHYCRRGLDKREAEQMFIKYIQGMKEYGYHLYSAIWITDDNININIYVGISLGGIALFERDCDQHKLSLNNLQNSKITYQKKLYVNFEWLEIENLCFSKHILCIVVRKTESLKAKDNNRIKYKLRMDDKKSYFAFNLASEHHQFYMRLKNSFISLKSISDELNIPITLKHQNLKYQTTNGKQTLSKELPMYMLNDDNNNDNNKNPNTNSSAEIVISKNHIGIDKQSNTYNNDDGGGGIVGGSSRNTNSNTKNCDVEIIDYTIGSTIPAVRVKNTKKSMLNDNRLLKFKEKYLRRTKSTAGCEINSISVIEKIREKNNTTKVKSFKKLIEKALYNKECDTNSNHNNNNNNKITKEEYQNKENECPKNYLDTTTKNTIQFSQISSQSNSDLTEPPQPPAIITTTESETSEDQLKIYSSPNRNRVKMGTRVFSSKILNKSFDNIYERFTKSQQFDSVSSSLDVRAGITSIESTDGTSEDGGFYASIDYNYEPNTFSNKFTVLEKQFDYNNDDTILSNNNNKLYSLDKDNIGNSTEISTTSQNGEAYVIHSSIHSDRPCQYNSFTLPNETMSESLMEKFNNLSHNSSAMNERKLTKITVIKERIKIPSSHNNSNDISQQEIANHNNIKYATISLGTKGHRTMQIDETLNKTKEKELTLKSYTTDDISITTSSIITENQDSIFIDNKCSRKSNNMTRSQKKISKENNFDSFTLGISIIQGTNDNNVYVKDLIKNGPGEKAGIKIADQIIAVNGISLLNLSYNESLRLLQNTGRIVDLIVSQIILYNNNNHPTNINKSTTNNNCFNVTKENDNKIYKINKNSKTTTINDSNDIIYLNENVNLNSNSTVITLSSTTNKRQNNKEIYKSQINYQQQNIIDTYNNHENIIKKTGNNEIYGKEDIILRKSALDSQQQEQQMNIDEAINPVNNKEKHWKNSGNFVDIRNKLIDSTISTTTRKTLMIEPKDVAIICISNDQKSNETVEYASVLKKSQRLTGGHGHSRKYIGPIRYPVTPIKGNTSIIIENKKNLSLLPDDDEQLVI